jgi:hypothetical protein
MPSLAETNPYLRDPEARRRLLADNAWQSSVFEGARALPRPDAGRRKASSRSRRRTDSTMNETNSE